MPVQFDAPRLVVLRCVDLIQINIVRRLPHDHLIKRHAHSIRKAPQPNSSHEPGRDTPIGCPIGAVAPFHVCVTACESTCGTPLQAWPDPMKLPLEIFFQGIAPSDAIRAAVRRHAAKLERLCPDIMRCRTSVVLNDKHKHQGKPMRVRIDLTIPGRELVSNREYNEDAYVAIHNAFDDMSRMLEDVVRVRRGQIKHHASSSPGDINDIARVRVPRQAATAGEVRDILGPFESDLIAQVMATGATAADVTQAYAWLRSDEHLLRGLQHDLEGAAAKVFDILDAAYPNFDADHRMD
jgi:ribosome-associated translation inhibitor RaiA